MASEPSHQAPHAHERRCGRSRPPSHLPIDPAFPGAGKALVPQVPDAVLAVTAPVLGGALSFLEPTRAWWTSSVLRSVDDLDVHLACGHARECRVDMVLSGAGAGRGLHYLQVRDLTRARGACGKGVGAQEGCPRDERRRVHHRADHGVDQLGWLLVHPHLRGHQHADRAPHRAGARAALARVHRPGAAPHLRRAQHPVHRGANAPPRPREIPSSALDVGLSVM
mmetsp:Transcript_100594/g.280176  ORF Transcript_100594/g.280176 Transcript_100594/m.280176 type:complete len:224 (+) Transcript_100594:634-1305(+)